MMHWRALANRDADAGGGEGGSIDTLRDHTCHMLALRMPAAVHDVRPGTDAG